MRKINTLSLIDSLLIWTIRQVRMENPFREFQVRILFSRIFSKEKASNANLSLKKIIQILPKINNKDISVKYITAEEEKILSLFYLRKNKNQITKIKIVESLYIDKRMRFEFLNEISKLRNFLYNSHNCFITMNKNKALKKISDLNKIEYQFLKSIRIWFKALQEDLDTFGMLYKFHLESDSSHLTVSFHSLIEKLVLNKKSDLEINCIYCKKISIDEIKLIDLINLGIKNQWNKCENILKNDIKVFKYYDCLLILKQLVTDIIVSSNVKVLRRNKNVNLNYYTNYLNKNQKQLNKMH